MTTHARFPRARRLATLAGSACLLTVSLACSTPYGRAVAADVQDSYHVGLSRSLVSGLFVQARASVINIMFGRAYSTSIGNDFGQATSWSQDALGVGFMGMAWSSHDTSWAPLTEIDPAKPLVIPANDAYRREYSYLCVGMAADRNGDPVPLTVFSLDQIGRVEVGFHLFVGGVSLGFDVVQFVDLLATVVGFDLLDDAPLRAAPDTEGLEP